MILLMCWSLIQVLLLSMSSVIVQVVTDIINVQLRHRLVAAAIIRRCSEWRTRPGSLHDFPDATRLTFTPQNNKINHDSC